MSSDKYENHEHLDSGMESGEALSKIKTAGSISISPELFEKIYLSPQNAVKGDLRKTFANPTPVALGGFLLSLTPLTCDLMNWREAQVGNGSASIGAYLAFGGPLMMLGGIGEWILGNTFPATVFLTFGSFWFTFGFTLIPWFHAYGNYAPYDKPAAGLATIPFNNAFGFFLVWMGVLCFVYLVCAIRTNLVFVLIFFFIVPTFGCLTAAFWYIALGNTDRAMSLIIAGGALAFVVCCLGWWIFAAILFAALDFPIQLPVGDLSHIIKGGSEKV